MVNIKRKSKCVTFWLCLLGGWLGVHRYYVGKIGTGILYTFTCGMFCVGWIVDLIWILIGTFTDQYGQLLAPAHRADDADSLAGNGSYKIPFSQKRRLELATDYLSAADVYRESMNKTTDICSFVSDWDIMIHALKNVIPLEGKVKGMTGSPTADVLRLEGEFQWHLRDAIERARDETVVQIKGKYRNSKSHQEFYANSFEEDIRAIRSRFDEESQEFADHAVNFVRRAAGLPCQDIPDQIRNTDFTSNIELIDSMDGHDFEYWCADLLRKLGYNHVDVTRGSGDQGVDVLAQKDGLKYAIQCKCYTSNLGNTPVQEVVAGKNFYHCHVAAVMTNRYFTSSAKELAEANEVLLWDRDWISTAITAVTAESL